MNIVQIRHCDEAADVLRKIGVDPYGISAMTPKTRHLNLLVRHQPCRIANILKQELLSLGGDAAVARGAVSCSIETTDILMMGTAKQLAALADKLDCQPFGLRNLGYEIRDVLCNYEKKDFIFKTARRKISLSEKTFIMGILNVTPDSFSDGNQFYDRQKAIDRGLQMADEGADILDIGGESTRPGATAVRAADEIKRVIPVIEGLARKTKLPISIDTTKAKVARAALQAGAEIVNDISALHGDKKMISVVQEEDAALILMHMRGNPRNMQTGDLHYDELMPDIIDYLKKACQSAVSGGIQKECLVLDPGIGFGKTAEDNFKIIKSLADLKCLGFPLMIGTSRKSFIGKATGEKAEDRIDGTGATVTAAILNGCSIVRVHDVAAMKKVVAVADAIVHA
ncbi:MAG: dihydropteroate synthase [Smithellaceae bacterium]